MSRIRRLLRYRKQIRRKIIAGQNIRLRVTQMNEKIDALLRILIYELTRIYRAEALRPVMLTCIRETLENGLKANIKSYLFAQNNINAGNIDSYEHGLRILRSALRNENYSFFLPMTRRAGFYSELKIMHNPTVIRVFVRNNSLMTNHEEKRIREKFHRAMDYGNFIDFLLNEIDESESAGLGIAMIITLLRKYNINPHLYRIYRSGECTVVRISFPLSEDYSEERLCYRPMNHQRGHNENK